MNMTSLRLLVFLCCLLCTCPAWPQPGQVQFTRGDITRDLSHNQVNCFYRDQQGFVWIGTMNGLNRYDGYTYRHYFSQKNDSSSLTDNYIDKIFPYPGGYMLVITRMGGSLYNFATDRFDQYPERRQHLLGLPDTLPLKIVAGKNGDYWLLFSRGRLYRLDAHAQKAEPFILEEAGDTAEFTDVAEDNKGSTWLITNKGELFKIDAQTLQWQYRSDAISKALNGKISSGYAVYPQLSDQCWVWLQNDPEGALLLQTNTGAVRRYTAKPWNVRQLQNDNVTGIVSDPAGYVWIATDPGGLHLVNHETGELQYVPHNPEDPYSVSQNAIISIYKDPQGLIWLGTYKKGLNYFNPNLPRFPLVKHDPAKANSLPFNDVNDFAEDAAGNLWIATNGDGLLYYDRQKNSYQRYLAGPGSISSNVLVCIYIDSKGRLWIGSYYGGLDCLENGRFTSYRPDAANPRSLSDNNVWEIFEDSKQRLWIGTLRGGINLFDPATKDFTHYKGSQPNSVKSDYNNVTIEDDKGNIWFGTYLGIDILEAESDRFVHIGSDRSKAGSLSNENIYTIFQDSKKRIWIGTREGLNLFLPATRDFITFTKKDGLPNNTILNILEDQSGDLWISTHNGLSQATVTGEGSTTRLTCINYNELNNLQGRDFNENAALKTRRGELIFGGSNGFNIFDPGKINNTIPAAEIRFTGFDLFNKPVRTGERYNNRVILPQSIASSDHITLAYNQNVFSVEFATLDFSRTERTRFAYRLDGFNNDWLITDAGIRKAPFTNLSPGEYTLRVKAVYDNGEMSAQEAALTITILPPWWLTPWAWLLYGVLIVAALVLARHIVIRRARARFALEQERKEAKRMHELDEMKIEFITNISHEFRTPLSLILAPLDKLKQAGRYTPEQEKSLHLIQRNVKRLLNLVNQLLDFRKMDVEKHQLFPQPGNLVAFIKEIASSFSDVAEQKHIQFRLASDVDELPMVFDHDKMEKVIMNLLGNAYKFTPDGGQVSIGIRIKEAALGSFSYQEYVIIQVTDSGIGIEADELPRIFHRFHRSNMPEHIINPGSGIGLAIVQEFVQGHDGKVTVSSTPGQGSCFTVSLPVKRSLQQESLLAPPPGAIKENPGIAGDRIALLPNDLSKAKKPHILLAEDNDEFRQFLKDTLQPHYRVTTAANGKEAWLCLQEETPALVITDVMMPLMNGIELAGKMKKHPVTAGIPVLLLTARSTEEQQVEGLSTGANDYIVKPFSLEILLQKIKNLLKEQTRKPIPRITIATTPVPDSNPDEKWLHEILVATEANLGNPAFSVEDLARRMSMSRAGLYKKMLALTGKSPVGFIRDVRLEHARQLLRKRQFTIAEIAYEVGFSDPKYFTKTFKKVVGILPSAYAADADLISGSAQDL